MGEVGHCPQNYGLSENPLFINECVHLGLNSQYIYEIWGQNQNYKPSVISSVKNSQLIVKSLQLPAEYNYYRRRFYYKFFKN